MDSQAKPDDPSAANLDPALAGLIGVVDADVLKRILDRGYQIVPPTCEVSFGGEDSAPLVADMKKMGVGQIISLWQRWDHDKLHASADFCKQLAERALKLGEPLLAFDVLKTALKQFPGHVRLRQLQAVALSRSGVVEEATKGLQALLAEGHEDEETLGNLARTLKDRWESATDLAERRRLLEEAFAGYERAYRHPKGGYWTGINAATLAACLGLDDRAADLAREVESECLRRIEGAADDEHYWELATLGEAALVRRDFAGAETWYRRAAASAADEYGNIGPTRRNAMLLLRYFGEDVKRLNAWLPMPRVAVFSGHMVDQPGRSSPRFPSLIEPAVASAIRERVEALDIKFAYASAACGSDILFHEAVAARGGEVNIVIPYELDRFMRDSVCLEAGSTWEHRLNALLDREQTRLIVASQGDIHDIGVSNEYSNQFMFGLAGIRAFQMRTELAAMAVWDGQVGDGIGGTQSAVARWRAFGIQPATIDLAEIFRRELSDSASAEGVITLRESSDIIARPIAPISNPAEFSGQMMALLFADVVGFSKLTEEEVPLFVEHFLKPVAHLCEHGKGCPSPVQRNTWGDALHFVFRTVADAGLFALILREQIASTDWLAKGFRVPLSLRTGLHVGPVYKCSNPVTGREDYVGTHVSRAARIEPVTPKGEVYASEVFAAIAFAERVSSFACEYVGQIGLAKEYGTYPTYHVRRR